MAKAYIRELLDFDNSQTLPVTVADAVYVQKTDSSGTVTQQKLSAKLTEMESNFTDGCNTIINALKELGVTPSATTPEGIVAAIKQLYSDRYNSGVAQGHADVIADPGGYGLITQDEYNTYGQNMYNAGVTYADGRVNTSSASYTQGYSNGSKNALANLSFSSFAAYFSYSETSDEGTKARVVGSGQATCYAQNGTIYLTVRGDGTATAWQWSNPNWVSEHSTSATGTGSNSKRISA